MKPLSSETRRLLDLARDDEPPSPEVCERVERSLANRLAAGAGAFVTSAALTKSAAGAALGLSLAKPIAAVGLTVGMAAAGWQAADWFVPEQKPAAIAVAPAPRAAAKPETRPAIETPATPLEQPGTPPSEPERAAMPARSPSVASRPEIASEPAAAAAASSAVSNELRAETEALRQAQGALRDGDAARALALLDGQDARYESGILQQERAAARVMALCQAGNAVQARAEAARFEARFPRSPLVARVQSSCQKP